MTFGVQEVRVHQRAEQHPQEQLLGFGGVSLDNRQGSLGAPKCRFTSEAGMVVSAPMLLNEHHATPKPNLCGLANGSLYFQTLPGL